MKVVFLTKRYWPAVGGVEKYMHRLAQALMSMGHEVQLVTAAHADGLPGRETYEGVEIHRFPAHRSPMRAGLGLLRLRPVFAGADVIHVSDTLMLEYFYRAVAWSLPKKPLFLTRHGMSYTCPVPELEKARARRTLGMVDGIIHDGCFIEPWLGVTPDMVPDQGLFPEADDLPYVPEPSPNSATFVGRLDADGGIGIYIDAVRVLKEKYNLPLRLEVYGDGTQRKALEEQTQVEGLPVRFHGWQADAQERVTDGCFAFIDGRMAMQEAMARRRLVVAAYVDPLKRDYVNGEPFSPYLLSGGDGETLAALVSDYARHDAKRTALVARAYAHARTLSWKRTAANYVKLWETAPRRRTLGTSLLRRLKLAKQLLSERHAPDRALQW